MDTTDEHGLQVVFVLYLSGRSVAQSKSRQGIYVLQSVDDGRLDGSDRGDGQ
jgi:hypothetical protein